MITRNIASLPWEEIAYYAKRKKWDKDHDTHAYEFSCPEEEEADSHVFSTEDKINILQAHYFEDPRLDIAIDAAVDALEKLEKIEHIKTDCAECDEYKSCVGCGGYLQYEQEVHRILEGVK